MSEPDVKVKHYEKHATITCRCGWEIQVPNNHPIAGVMMVKEHEEQEHRTPHIEQGEFRWTFNEK